MIRLLIADDEALERETLADIVARRFEHEVTIETAENGRKAADTAVLWGADLILMDIEMPGMNGLDAARAVLEQRPECKVIFVTAYSLFQYAHEAMHLGACDYLLKPVNPDEVEASIRKAIRQIEAGRRVLRSHAGLPDAGFLQAYLQIEALQIGGVLVPDGPGLVRAGPVVGVLHAQEHVTGFHLLEIAKAHLGHIAVDLGFQHHAVQLGVGVVRLLDALAALQPVEVQQEEEDDEQQHAQDDPRREPEKGQQAVIQGQLQQFVGKTGFEAVHDGPRAFSFPVCPDPRG